MKIAPTDLVVRYDPDSDKILLLVPRHLSADGTLKRFFELPLAESVTTGELASELGAAVASFLHARHPDRIAVAPGVAGTDEPIDVSFADARALIDRLGDRSTVEDLDAVTNLLESASKGGDGEATDYLKNKWPSLRPIFLRRISRDG
jgi:hypothetical protein